MKKYKVQYLPEFFDQLERIEDFLRTNGASSAIARRFTSSIQAYCESMNTFPYRGRPRNDLSPGLLTTNYRGNTNLAYQVREDESEVWFIGVYYAGEDFESILTNSPDDH